MLRGSRATSRTVFSVLFALTLALAPAIAEAQTKARPGTPEFARLVDGKSLVITLDDGRKLEDVFLLSATGLTASSDQVPAEIPFSRVVRVTKSTFRVRHGSLIGLGVGAAVLLWLDCRGQSGPGCSNLYPISAGFGAGLGAGIGAAVGGSLNWANRENDLIFDASRKATTVTLAPILSQTRRGAAVSISWR